MNQNISKESYTKEKKKGQTENRFSSLFSIRNIIIYILTLLISMAGGSNDLNFLMIPLGFSMGVAAISYEIPSLIVILCSLLGATIKYGFGALGINVVAYLILFFLLLLFRPRRNDTTNEKLRLGRFELACIFIIYFIFRKLSWSMIFEAATVALLGYSFYKLFVNGFDFFNAFTINQALTNEEVVAAAAMITVAISTISTYGFGAFYLSNFLCIALILFIGWRYGYFSGMLSGLISGIIISMFANISIYLCLIYALTGLVIGIYKKINFETIPDWVKPTKMLPVASGEIEEGTEEYLQSYGINVEEIKNKSLDRKDPSYQKKINIYKKKLFNNIDDLQQNLLYDYIFSNNGYLIEDIFDVLINKYIMTEKSIKIILNHHNIYLADGKGNPQSDKEEEIRTMVRAINISYREYKEEIAKVLKIAEKKKTYVNVDEEKIVTDKIKDALLEKNIITDGISYEKDRCGRKIIKICTNRCGDESGESCFYKHISSTINKTFLENLDLVHQSCGVRTNSKICKFEFVSQNKFVMDVAKKQVRRDDREKVGELIDIFTGLNRNISFAFSDGYESNIDDSANDVAYNNSKVINGIIKTIYEKEENDNLAYSQLISSIKAADLKQIAADYDYIGCNLFEGNLKILKGASSEIFIKSARNVIKVSSEQKADDNKYIERKLHDNDMLVLVSDGVIQTNLDNPDWIETLLKDIHTDVPDNIADIIISQAKTNSDKKIRNDMSVLILKFRFK